VGTAGPCCGEPGNAGDPCAPVLGGEDGALARRPQAPLEGVEKVVTTSSTGLPSRSGTSARQGGQRPVSRSVMGSDVGSLAVTRSGSVSPCPSSSPTEARPGSSATTSITSRCGTCDLCRVKSPGHDSACTPGRFQAVTDHGETAGRDHCEAFLCVTFVHGPCRSATVVMDGGCCPARFGDSRQGSRGAACSRGAAASLPRYRSGGRCDATAPWIASATGSERSMSIDMRRLALVSGRPFRRQPLVPKWRHDQWCRDSGGPSRRCELSRS
jgi:hypothetical protein